MAQHVAADRARARPNVAALGGIETGSKGDFAGDRNANDDKFATAGIPPDQAGGSSLDFAEALKGFIFPLHLAGFGRR